MKSFVFYHDPFIIKIRLDIFGHELNFFLLLKFVHKDIENQTHKTDQEDQQQSRCQDHDINIFAEAIGCDIERSNRNSHSVGEDEKDPHEHDQHPSKEVNNLGVFLFDHQQSYSYEEKTKAEPSS